VSRKTYEVTLRIDSYISEPYLPELSDLIDIQKKSGMNRARSEAKRDECLKAYLKREGISAKQYDNLVQMANRKWYMTQDGFIYIPRHHLAGALVQTVGSSPAAVRGKFDVDSFRHYVRISDFLTNKKEKDEVFDRYVKNDLTNQRRRQVSEVIVNFDAVGKVEVHQKFKVEEFTTLLSAALEDTGVGSCRKMGYGRGAVTKIVAV
jgi:hypothetical protein